MRTGACKFGPACKFHHPQPTSLGTTLPIAGPAAFGSTGSPVLPSSGLPYTGGLPAWSLPRVPYLSVPHLQAPQPYMPLVVSPSQGIQGWNTYLVSILFLKQNRMLFSFCLSFIVLFVLRAEYVLIFFPRHYALSFYFCCVVEVLE